MAAFLAGVFLAAATFLAANGGAGTDFFLAGISDGERTGDQHHIGEKCELVKPRVGKLGTEERAAQFPDGGGERFHQVGGVREGVMP